MGCLFALLAGFAPRIALVLVWIFTNLVDRAFHGFLIPLLGLLLFPYATLFYVLYIYQNAFQYFQMGYASALAWVLFVIILAVTVLVLRWSNMWVYYEGERAR